MLSVVRKLFVPTYNFYNNKNYFGTLKASLLYPKALLFVKEGNYIFSREKWFEGRYFCSLNSYNKAIAEKPLRCGHEYYISQNDLKYHLRRGDLFYEKGEFHFDTLSNGHHLGSIKQNPTRFILSIDLDERIPKNIQCFMFWLSWLAWAGSIRRW